MRAVDPTARIGDRWFSKKLISLILLVGLLIGIFYLMWIISRGYPFELALLPTSGDRCNCHRQIAAT